MLRFTTLRFTFILLFFLMIASKPAFSDEMLKSFSEKESVLNFEIDGISILTPIEKVTGILTQNGWKEIYEDPANLQGDLKRLRFAKGDFISPGQYKSPEESRNGYELTIIDATSRNHTGIYMTQQSIELKGKMHVASPRLNPDVVDTYARALKDAVCNGIQNKQERQEVCPPNSAPGKPVSLGAKGRGGKPFVRLMPIVDGQPEQLTVSLEHRKPSAGSESGFITIMHIKRPQ